MLAQFRCALSDITRNRRRCSKKWHPTAHHTFQILADRFFRRPRLAGVPKSQFIGFRQPPSSYRIDPNRLLPRRALQNYSIQVLNPPRQFRPPAQHIIQLFHLLVNRRRALEIQFFAGLFAFRFKSSAQRAPARLQKRHQPVHLHVVLFLGATRKTRRQAHFHLGIQASRKGRVSPDLNLAPPHLEKIQHLLREALRRAPRRKRPIVRSRRWQPLFVHGNAPRHVAARVGIAQIYL